MQIKIKMKWKRKWKWKKWSEIKWNDMKWNENENDMKMKWKWNENDMKMKWKWHENDMNMTWKWHENEMKMKWKWNENDMKMKWKWNENEMKMTWTWHENEMKMKIKDNVIIKVKWNEMKMKCKRNEHENGNGNENEWTNERTNEWMNESTKQRTNEAMNQWINESMNQWTNEPMNQWIKESMNQCITESMDQWINEICRPHLPKLTALKPSAFKLFMWNRALPTVSCTFCPCQKKTLRTCAFVCGFYVKSSSRYSLVHILPASSSKSAPNMSYFCGFYVKSSSRYSLVHILPTSSSKSVPNMSICFPIWKWNRALATVSCTFRRPHLPKVLRTWQLFNTFKRKSSSRYSPVHVLLIEAHNRGNRDPTSANTEATLPEKKHRVSRPSLFKPEFTRSRPVTLPNYLMMMWLTWWCGGMMVRMLPMTIVRNSEVF